MIELEAMPKSVYFVPAVIKFYGDTCAPCKMMVPIYAKVENIYKERVDFYSINVDKVPIEQLHSMGIYTVPSFMFCKAETENKVVSGAMPLASLCGNIETYCL